MRVTNKLIAIHTAFVITFVSLSSFHDQRLLVNADDNTFDVTMLTETIKPMDINVDEITSNEVGVTIDLDEAEENITDVDEIVEVEEVTVESIPDVSNEEIELLALVTMAEAEGESEEGKRLVIDVILNRVDSGRFDDTITGVIYAPNQFTSMWNGRVDRCYVTDEIRQLVIEELIDRTNNEVLYFRMNHYHTFGTPMFQVGGHYFSK